jgi:membrane dipeptidase
VAEMESLGVLMDLAHLSPKGFYEVLDLYDPPVLVTHANAKTICDHRRNLDDAQLRALSDHGGLIGISQVSDFISEANATVDDMLDHIVYISEQIGVEHVALGSDFDGADDMVLSNIGEYNRMPSLLAGRGFSQAEIQLILSGNALRIVEEIL